MNGQKVTLAAACMQVEHDKPSNLEKHLRFIEEASEEEVRLLVFPECSLQGYTWTWDAERGIYLEDEEQRLYFQEVSEPIPGPTTNIIAKHAARHNMLIQIGMAEKAEKDGETVLYNSVALIGPKGLIGVFRKVHSAPNPVFRRGDRFIVFDTMIGKVGPIICADIVYPESVRVLALKGAEVVTMSTAWGMMTQIPKSDMNDPSWAFSGYFSGYKYDLLGRATALVNGLWMIISDQVGAPKNSKEKCYGHSRILDPSGRIIASIGYKEGLVTAKVDIQEGIDPDRFKGRRPESYEILCLSPTRAR